MVEQTNNKANQSDGSEGEFFDACDDIETGKSEMSTLTFIRRDSRVSFCSSAQSLVSCARFPFLFYIIFK